MRRGRGQQSHSIALNSTPSTVIPQVLGLVSLGADGFNLASYLAAARLSWVSGLR